MQLLSAVAQPVTASAAALATAALSVTASAGGALLALADGRGLREAAYVAAGYGLLTVTVTGTLAMAGVVLGRAYWLQYKSEDARRQNLLREQALEARAEPAPEPAPPPVNANGIYWDNGLPVKTYRGRKPAFAAEALQVLGRVAVQQTPAEVTLVDVSRGMWLFARCLASKEGKLSEDAWGDGNPFSLEVWRRVRGELVRQNLLRWRNPDYPRQGLVITAMGRAFIRTRALADTPPPPKHVPL
jgi:hypothetical protein